MNYKRLAINDFKNRMRSCVFWNRHIIKLNEAIEDINYKLDGISAIEFRFDNIKYESTVRERHMRRIALYDKQNELMEEVKKYENYFMEVDAILQKMPKDIRNATIRVYVLNENQEDVAREMYWERTTLLYNIDKQLEGCFDFPHCQ